jgi:hypothetical protein
VSASEPSDSDVADALVTVPKVKFVVVSTAVAVTVVPCAVAVSPGAPTVEETVPPTLSVTTSYRCWFRLISSVFRWHPARAAMTVTTAVARKSRIMAGTSLEARTFCARLRKIQQGQSVVESVPIWY